MSLNLPYHYIKKTLIVLFYILIFVSAGQAETLLSETFEGSFPEGNGWTVGDLTGEPLNVGDDFWDDTSYRDYNGRWSGWSAYIGTQLEETTVTDTIFTEGFENGMGSWTTGDWNRGSDSDYWGQSNERDYYGSYSAWVAENGNSWYYIGYGPNSWWNKYDNDMSAYMYRSVDLSDYDSVTIYYRYWIKSEINDDKFYVLYKKGTTWYIKNLKTGDSSGWKRSSATIPTTATNVGFYFKSDGSDTFEGVYVDYVRLKGTKTTTTHVSNSDLHQYDDHMDAYMQKMINLDGYSSATLSYKYWLDVEDYYDWLKVQTSSDGSNWVDHKKYSDGYDSKDGDSKARKWYSDSVDLTSYVGSTVYIRFLFHSDSSKHDREGAYLDDIKVDAVPISPPEPVVSLSGVPSSTKIDQQFTISIKLQNNGGSSIDGGIHLHFNDLEIVSISRGDFSSSNIGNNYVEYYNSVADGRSRTAYVTLKATGVNAKIYYRGWLKDSTQAYCSATGRYQNKNYRNPTDVQCRSNFMDYLTNTKSITVIYYGVSLSPASQSKIVNSGENAVNVFTIKNEGNKADTFSLSTTRGSLSTYSVTLNAGSSTTFTLTDSSAVPGTYIRTITATSQGNSNKKATATTVNTFVSLLSDLSISSSDITFLKVGGN